MKESEREWSPDRKLQRVPGTWKWTGSAARRSRAGESHRGAWRERLQREPAARKQPQPEDDMWNGGWERDRGVRSLYEMVDGQHTHRTHLSSPDVCPREGDLLCRDEGKPGKY